MQKESPSDRYEAFGDCVTMDHMDAEGPSRSGRGHTALLNVLDLATGYTAAYPVRSKDVDTTLLCLRNFVGDKQVKKFYCDGAPVLSAAAKEMKIPCNKSKASRPQTNGVIERCNQEISKGAKTVLMQAGLAPPFWDLAVQHFCHCRNVRKSEGSSAWLQRHGVEFKGALIPVGALVDFMPTATSGAGQGMAKFAPPTVKGIFVGWEFHAGEVWSKGYKVIPLSALDNVSFMIEAEAGDCRARVQVVAEVKPVLSGCPGSGGFRPCPRRNVGREVCVPVLGEVL